MDATARPVHPWVAEGQRRIRFGIQPIQADWSTYLDLLGEVEALGFDSFWVVDHPITANMDCWIALAAAALRTSRLHLGSLTNCIYYRNPVLLARMAADVDHLSNGRLVLGLGVGDNVDEFARMAIPFPRAPQRYEALEETVAILRGLWGTDPFTLHGQHFQVDAAQLQLPPKQPVPLLIAGGGERRTLRHVARYADMSNFGPHEWVGNATTLTDVRRKCEALREHCDAEGRPYESILRSHYEFVILAKTRAELQSKLDAIPPARRDFWGTILFAGTPDEARDHYASLVEAGMQYFVAVVPAPFHTETLRLLGERVLPEFGSG